jgi:hypothetical protein
MQKREKGKGDNDVEGKSVSSFSAFDVDKVKGNLGGKSRRHKVEINGVKSTENLEKNMTLRRISNTSTMASPTSSSPSSCLRRFSSSLVLPLSSIVLAYVYLP